MTPTPKRDEASCNQSSCWMGAIMERFSGGDAIQSLARRLGFDVRGSSRVTDNDVNLVPPPFIPIYR
jgi:hypothetical protein